jgi:hypothetical protein
MTETANALLRELAEHLSETWDEDSDGCRYDCGGNEQIDGVRGAIAGKPITPHAETCIYRRVQEYLRA